MRKPVRFYLFRRKPIIRKDRYELWRGAAILLGFEDHERLRLEYPRPRVNCQRFRKDYRGPRTTTHILENILPSQGIC